MTVTRDEYNALDTAFNYFNEELFDSKLSPCLITFQRRSRTRGYYSPDRFSNRNFEARADEIALNPSTFEGRTDEEILSTLVHEMVHQYQSEHGTPGRGRYHNKEWAMMMMERGLMPSDTGEPGGNMTGQSMTHYIIKDGPFQLACRRLIDRGFRLNWQDKVAFASVKVGPTGKAKTKAAKRSSKTKFTCFRCKQNAWAKQSANLLCGVCYRESGEIVRMKNGQATLDDPFSVLISQ
jgi:predicted SprT family Zn-dependent metalloprotease